MKLDKTTRKARAARAFVLGHKSRIWFWRPQWYWFGWKTLIPFVIGHDEHARWTIMLGWTITGRAIIALWDCSDPECQKFARASDEA